MTDTDCIPSHFMFVYSKIGGIILGAYFNDELIRFTFTIPAFDNKENKIYHYMQFAGVLNPERNKNVGFCLFEKQIELSKQVGI